VHRNQNAPVPEDEVRVFAEFSERRVRTQRSSGGCGIFGGTYRGSSTACGRTRDSERTSVGIQRRITSPRPRAKAAAAWFTQRRVGCRRQPRRISALMKFP